MSYLVWRQDDLVGNRVQRYNTMEVRCGLKSVNVRKHPIKHEKVGQSEKNISLHWAQGGMGDHGTARNSTETRR